MFTSHQIRWALWIFFMIKNSSFDKILTKRYLMNANLRTTKLIILIKLYQ